MRMSSCRNTGELGIKELIEWIASEEPGKNICIAFHRGGDPDAVASAIGVRELINSVNPSLKVSITPSEGINQLSKVLLIKLGMSEENLFSGDVSSCNYFIIVDTSTHSQLGGLNELVRSRKYIVIDHHEINELLDKAIVKIYDPCRPSVSELIIRSLYVVGVRPPHNLLTLLLAGVLYDTKFLRLADDYTLESVILAIRMGGDYREAQEILTSREVGMPEKIAVLKGIARLGLYSLNDEWLLAITCISSNESSVLRTLIEAGADIAIAMAKKKKYGRVIIRASSRFLKSVNSSISAEIAHYLGGAFMGEGGGHGGAAGAVVNAKITGRELLKALRKFFKDRGLKMKLLEEGKWLRECE